MAQQVGGVEFDVTVDSSGAVSASGKVVQANEQMQDAFQDTDAAAQKSGTGIAKGAKKGSTAMQGMGRQAGAAGIQIQQLVGQIQGGQNVFNALSAQAADLGIVLGAPLLGAVAGLGAAFAGVLLPSLFDTEDKTQDLIDKLRELAETKILSKEQAALLAQEERKLIKEKQALIAETEEEIKTNNEQLKNISNVIQRGQLGAKAYANLQESVREITAENVAYNAALKTTAEEISESTVKLDYYTSMMEGSTEQTKAQKEEIEGLISAIEAQASAIGKTDRQIAISAATQEGATESQIAAINTAYDAIEAEEKRAKAIVDGRKAAIEAQKGYESVLDEMFANQKKRDEEKAAQKEQAVSNVDKIKQDLLTEQQLRAEAFLLEGEQLKEALELEQITKAEFDEIEKERVAAHRQWLLDDLVSKKEQELAAEEKAANDRVAKEKAAQEAIQSLRQSAIGNAINLLDQFAGESKAAAIASIALSKGLAIAQTIQNTGVAVMKAMSVDPTGALAARASSLGAANVAMIAATGLAQAGTALSGSASATTYSNGVPATNTTSSSAAASSTSQAINISLAGSANYTSADIYGLIDQINEAVGDGYTLNYTGG